MRFQRLFGSSFLVLPTAVFMLNLPLNISPSVAPSWPSLNSPASLLYASANGLLPIRCNGSEFGHNLNLDSCRNALSYLPRPSSAETLSFGPRLRGGSNVVVPNRYLSSDGRCAIDISLVPTAPRAHASGVQLYTAAYVLLHSCAGRSPSQGGAAVDIGGDNNLIVSLRSYTPGVRCIPSVSGYPRLDNCGAILNEMEVSKEITTFGDAATSGVDVRTPYTIHEPRCTARIASTSMDRVITTWYDIYAALTAINAMCVRKRMSGIATGIGDPWTRGMLQVEFVAGKMSGSSE